MGILNVFHPLLPKDPRTLLGTKAIGEIKTIGNGLYYHFGIASTITSQLKAHPGLQACDTIHLQVNIDGLPLFKSSSQQFWPILGLLQKFDKPMSPFIIGLYSGNEKPSSLDEYLEEFVSEMKYLETHGIEHEGIFHAVSICNFVCDTPARAYIKQVKGHTGYYGCDKCTQRGHYLANHRTFPDTAAPLRTNTAFDEMSDEDHHNGPTILTTLNLGMVTDFALDYMHLVCLGVVKKLIILWLKGPLVCRIGGQAKMHISSVLVSLGVHLPKEFVRKPRSLRKVDYWKAKEFRMFLLYTGIIALKGKVAEAVFKNFLLLFVAIRILISPTMSSELRNYSSDLLITFVQHFSQLYGAQYVSYNIHALIHLPSDVQRHGCLDEISSFPFENYLGKIKRWLRKPNHPISQVIRRLSEQSEAGLPVPPNLSTKPPCFPVLKKEHHNGPCMGMDENCKQYSEAQYPNYCINIKKQRDSCVKIGDDVALVKNCVQNGTDLIVVHTNYS